MASWERRHLNVSSESFAYPTDPSFDQDVDANLRLLTLLDMRTEQDPLANTSDLPKSDAQLRRMLSLKSVVSTTSSNAERDASAQAVVRKTFRQIGTGSCGSVFAQDGKSLVYKLANNSDYHAQLWEDYKTHTKIAEHFERYIIDEITVPACHFYVPATEAKYFDHHAELIKTAEGSRSCKLPAPALVTERILPLPRPIRELLIDKYCSPALKDKARTTDANKDCLVRVYLGSMQGRVGGMFFSLRNFKLHLNHMIDLQLDVGALARRMGIALAVMHWGAKTDARDVEFVLGSSAKKSTPMRHAQVARLEPQTYTGPTSYADEDFFCHVTELFVLDFNQVRSIEDKMNDEGIEMMVEAWRINDPYFPKPFRQTSAEKLVWTAFAGSYVEASAEVLKDQGFEEDEDMLLPRKFIAGIRQVEKERMQKRAK